MHMLSLASRKTVWKHFGNGCTTGSSQSRLVPGQPWRAYLTASWRADQNHMNLLLDQPKRAHILALVHPEPFPCSRSKKGLSFCAGGETGDLMVVLHCALTKGWRGSVTRLALGSYDKSTKKRKCGQHQSSFLTAFPFSVKLGTLKSEAFQWGFQAPRGTLN